MKKLIWLLILIGAVVGLTFVLRPQQLNNSTIQETSEQVDRKPVVEKDYVKYYGAEGKTALELLQEITNVESKQYSFGVFVESVNGVKPDEKHFWKLYVNGEEAQVGAGELETKNSDVIEWRIEEIKN